MDRSGVKAQIGFLPEQPYFYDYLTAHELLEYYGQLSGVPGKERKQRIEQVLQHVGLRDVKGVQLRKFSKGMLQRVGIAQAILHDPKLVFFDEPMSGLDPMGRREVRDLMEQLKHEGKTVFFSTHILSDAEALCDRVAIIHKGELRGVGAVEDLTSSVQGKVEVIWQGTQIPASMKALGAECHVTGDTVRAIIDENQQDAAIDALRRERLRLIAITPVRTSLETYFVEKLRRAETSPATTAGGSAADLREDSMSTRIAHIASNTFREAVRDRVLYNLIAFALLLSGAAILVGQISIEIEKLVVINLGLTAVSLFGSRDRNFYRHRPGLQGNRKAHALHRAFASGSPLGVHRRQILWAGRHAGGEHVLHGDRRIRGVVLRIAQICARRCADSGCSVFHRSRIPHHLFVGAYCSRRFLRRCFPPSSRFLFS